MYHEQQVRIFSGCPENKKSANRNLHASQHTVIKKRPKGVDILNGLKTSINKVRKQMAFDVIKIIMSCVLIQKESLFIKKLPYKKA